MKLTRKTRLKREKVAGDRFEYVPIATDHGPSRQRAYRPSEVDRETVRQHALAGLPPHKIAELMALTRKSLLRHFRVELKIYSHDVSRPASAARLGLVEETLFPTARKALLFAVTAEGRPARPASSRMVDATGGGRGLSGLDAAGQAGMIMNILEGLGKVENAVLVASAAPRARPCTCRRPCCSGRRVNSYWAEAIDVLAHAADQVIEESEKAEDAGRRRTKASYALRREILLKLYGGGREVTFVEIANRLSISAETVSKYHKIVHNWLRGARGGKHSKAVTGVENQAWSEAETALRRLGIVSDEPTVQKPET